MSVYSALRDVKVWGCPAYVLDQRIQDGHKIPKWEPKARRGQSVGASKLHASSVGVIRNLTTDNLSPQFHVVYDNYFETVHATKEKEPNQWSDLIVSQREQAPINQDDLENVPELNDEWLTDEEMQEQRQQQKQAQPARLLAQ